MTCRACGHSDKKSGLVYPLGHQYDDRHFIEIGSVELVTDLSGVMGHPRMGDGTLHGMTRLWACPVCGTVRVNL